MTFILFGLILILTQTDIKSWILIKYSLFVCTIFFSFNQSYRDLYNFQNEHLSNYEQIIEYSKYLAFL
ncbi:unnamed protein product [Paramecium sonneborni]|uniref:Uncharacterized protein n=1 Tax=Paramecium sonneborni TaxID=65129 RepID=A0A8S1QZV8_9CILI|nr:unnamed protein product [Paramecium sonneborni]